MPELKDRNQRTPSFLASLVSIIILTLLFATAIPLDVPSSMAASNESAIRIALDAKGKLAHANIPEGVILPPGADAEKIFGGEHFPISIRLIVDGKVILEKTYKPSGLIGNGRIADIEFLPISSGKHQVEIMIMDDDQNFSTAFSGEVTFEKTQVVLFYYEESSNTFNIK